MALLRQSTEDLIQDQERPAEQRKGKDMSKYTAKIYEYAKTEDYKDFVKRYGKARIKELTYGQWLGLVNAEMKQAKIRRKRELSQLIFQKVVIGKAHVTTCKRCGETFSTVKRTRLCPSCTK